jgi:hypothetical protein
MKIHRTRTWVHAYTGLDKMNRIMKKSGEGEVLPTRHQFTHLLSCMIYIQLTIYGSENVVMTKRIVFSYLANGELPAWPDGQQPRFLQIKMPNTTVFRLRVRFDFRIRIQESAKKRENK